MATHTTDLGGKLKKAGTRAGELSFKGLVRNIRTPLNAIVLTMLGFVSYAIIPLTGGGGLLVAGLLGFAGAGKLEEAGVIG